MHRTALVFSGRSCFLAWIRNQADAWGPVYWAKTTSRLPVTVWYISPISECMSLLWSMYFITNTRKWPKIANNGHLVIPLMHFPVKYHVCICVCVCMCLCARWLMHRCMLCVCVCMCVCVCNVTYAWVHDLCVCVCMQGDLCTGAWFAFLHTNSCYMP